MAISVAAPRTLSGGEVAQLDPYAFFAVLGKRVIHPGGRTATAKLICRAQFAPGQHVLDVGCGVGTTTIEVASRFGATVTALDIAPLMLERAARNFAAAGVGGLASVNHGDITALSFADASFDRSSPKRSRCSSTDHKPRVVPYLGFILVSGTKPPAVEAN